MSTTYRYLWLVQICLIWWWSRLISYVYILYFFQFSVCIELCFLHRQSMCFLTASAGRRYQCCERIVILGNSFLAHFFLLLIADFSFIILLCPELGNHRFLYFFERVLTFLSFDAIRLRWYASWLFRWRTTWRWRATWRWWWLLLLLLLPRNIPSFFND